jgi:hypothetical protein
MQILFLHTTLIKVILKRSLDATTYYNQQNYSCSIPTECSNISTKLEGIAYE